MTFYLFYCYSVIINLYLCWIINRIIWIRFLLLVQIYSLTKKLLEFRSVSQFNWILKEFSPNLPLTILNSFLRKYLSVLYSLTKTEFFFLFTFTKFFKAHILFLVHLCSWNLVKVANKYLFIQEIFDWTSVLIILSVLYSVLKCSFSRETWS